MPALRAFGAMVGLQFHTLHLLRTQPRTEALEQLVQAVARSQVLGQEAAALTREGLGLQAAQAQVQYRRRQRHPCQLFG